MACRPTPLRAPPPRIPSSKPSLECSNTQVWHGRAPRRTSQILQPVVNTKYLQANYCRVSPGWWLHLTLLYLTSGVVATSVFHAHLFSLPYTPQQSTPPLHWLPLARHCPSHPRSSSSSSKEKVRVREHYYFYASHTSSYVMDRYWYLWYKDITVIQSTPHSTITHLE